MSKALKVTCDVKLHLSWEELHGIQGALKMMTKENFDKYHASLVKHGLKFPLSVWHEGALAPKKASAGSKWWIIDGHGLHAVVGHMIHEEGWTCPKLPCVEVEAESFLEAKRLVLLKSSAFHTMTEEGLYEFAHEIELPLTELEKYFELPQVNLPRFVASYGESEPKEKDTPKEKCPTCGKVKNSGDSHPS